MRDAESRFVCSTHAARSPLGRLLAVSVSAAALLLLLAGLAASPASAAYQHAGPPTGFFGADGTEASTIQFPGSLAIDQAGRRLYAVETNVYDPNADENDVRIHGFDLSHPYAPLGGNFPITIPQGRGEQVGVMAVDNSATASAGNFYYVEENRDYESRRSFLWGFNRQGEPLGGEFPVELTTPINGCGAGVDGDGHVWVGDLTSKTLKEYSAKGDPMLGSIKLQQSQGSNCYFTFDLNNNDLYVNGRFINEGNLFKYTAASDYANAVQLDPSNVDYDQPMNFDSTHNVLNTRRATYNSDGILLEEPGFGNASGEAFDESTGTAYATNYEHGIAIFPATGIIPDVTTGGATGTTVHADIDPAGGGDVTSCAFEYSTTTNYESSVPVPCEQATPYSSSQTVSATLPGLTPEVRYHYRAKASNADGTYIGAERSFVPHHVQDLKTLAPAAVGKHDATLSAGYTGTNQDTHYYFEWGTTSAYGNLTATAPGADDGAKTGPQPLAVPISGLTSDTVYHYRVVASNAEGTSVGEDIAFETVHAVEDLSVSFANLTGSSVTLQGEWSGDGTQTGFYFEWGATTAYGHTVPALPDGGDGGSGTGPKSVAVNLTELQPVSRYHFRLITSNPSGTTVSPDVTFKTPQLAAVDYVPALKITSTSAELRGTVNPRKTGATTYHFDYGPTSAYGQSTPESAPVGSDNSLHPAAAVAEGLSPGALYHYRIVATSPTGTIRGPDQKFMTIPGLPAISSSSIAGLTAGEAVLQADVSPNFGATVVYFQYGPTAAYGSETIPDAPLPGDAASHHVTADIAGLTPNSIYHYRAVATNYAGVAYGSDQTFETAGLPEIGSIGVSNLTKTRATISAQLNPRSALTSYRFEYGPTAGYGMTSFGSAPLAADDLTHTVSVELAGLTPGTTYHVRLSATNSVGQASGADQAFTTVALPVETPIPRPSCKKGQVKKKGKCVKKRRKHRHKSHKRRAH